MGCDVRMDNSSLADNRPQEQESAEDPTPGTPDVPIADIIRTLKENYGLEATDTKPAGGELDLNLKVDTDQGRFLVKVGAPRGSEEDWRDRILSHVAHVAPTLPVPQIIETRQQTPSTTFSDGNDTWQMRVFEWLDGDILAHVDPTLELLHSLGRTSAEVTEALASFDDTSMASHPWDLRTAAETLREHLPYLRSAERSAAVGRVLDMLETVQPRLETLPSATVHHDLNDHNILVVTSPDGQQRISGILDFNDALRTFRVADVAIAAGYAMLRQATPVDAAAAVVSGYYWYSPLSDEELGAVFPLAATRLCLNASLWTRRTADVAHEEAADYGRRRMADTWPMVEHLSTLDPDWAHERIRRACGLT